MLYKQEIRSMLDHRLRLFDFKIHRFKMSNNKKTTRRIRINLGNLITQKYVI